MSVHEAIVHIIASCLVRDSDIDWLSLLDEAWCGILAVQYDVVSCLFGALWIQ